VHRNNIPLQRLRRRQYGTAEEDEYVQMEKRERKKTDTTYKEVVPVPVAPSCR